MTYSNQIRSLVRLLMAGLAALFILAATAAQAQTLTVLHGFTGGADGANPAAGLTPDAAGNLYGTTLRGGFQGEPCFGACGRCLQTDAWWLRLDRDADL